MFVRLNDNFWASFWNKLWISPHLFCDLPKLSTQLWQRWVKGLNDSHSPKKSTVRLHVYKTFFCAYTFCCETFWGNLNFIQWARAREITFFFLYSNPIIFNLTFLRALDMKGDMASSYGTGREGWLVVARDILYNIEIFYILVLFYAWWLSLFQD